MSTAFAPSLTSSVLLLPGLAALITALGTYAIAVLGQQAYVAIDRRARLPWMIGAVVAGALAVWADAVLTMLAFLPPVRLGFRWPSLGASLVVALVGMAASASITLASRTVATTAAGGALCGLTVWLTQAVGLHALQVAGTIDWSLVRLGAALAYAVVLGALSATTWLRSRSHVPLGPIALFTVSVFGTHAIAMTAAVHRPGPVEAWPASLLGASAVTDLVGLVVLVVVAFLILSVATARRSHRRRALERTQLAQFAEVAVEGLAICSRGRIAWINRSLEAMSPGARATCIGEPVDALLILPPDTDLEHDCEVDAHLRRSPTTAASAAATVFDERPVPVRVIARTIELSGRPQMVLAIRDERDRLRAEASIKRLAESDTLTGLANRSRFNATLRERFAASRDSLDGGFALCAIDLDRFKSVNDSDGHAAGDAVLGEVGRRLMGLVRDGDLVARIGGDEFAIVASTGRDLQRIEALADRVVAELSRPYVVQRRVHQISASIGIAIAHEHGDDPDALQLSADLALYAAKADGRARHRLFEGGMRERMQERSGLEQALREALAHNGLRVAYQPQVDAKSGAVTGAEALVRWMHPVRGLVSPDAFIPVAEETQMIVPIGEWVLREACLEAAGWPEPLTVSVNLSPAQCREPTLPAAVAAALAWSGLPGRRLELEVTESVLVDDRDRVAAMLVELKGLGIRLALDDFGTGYSSLAHLHRFPFDRIKIDRNFVARVPDDAGSGAIVKAVVALGAGLSMQTTAEGVETEAQRRFVIDAGCDQIQGYLTGRPVAPDELPTAFRAASANRRTA